jgi:hypothetical protein
MIFTLIILEARNVWSQLSRKLLQTENVKKFPLRLEREMNFFPPPTEILWKFVCFDLDRITQDSQFYISGWKENFWTQYLNIGMHNFPFSPLKRESFHKKMSI